MVRSVTTKVAEWAPPAAVRRASGTRSFGSRSRARLAGRRMHRLPGTVRRRMVGRMFTAVRSPSLRELAAPGTRRLDLSSSDALMCTNMMCENVGDRATQGCFNVTFQL